MAKNRSMALARPQVVVMSAPKKRGGAIRRAAGHVKRKGKGLAVSAVKGAWEEKLAISAIGGAGLAGYLEGSGNLDFLPDPLGIGKTPTLAIGLYLGGRFMKNQRARQMGIGLASAVAFAKGLDAGQKSKK